MTSWGRQGGKHLRVAGRRPGRAVLKADAVSSRGPCPLPHSSCGLLGSERSMTVGRATKAEGFCVVLGMRAAEMVEWEKFVVVVIRFIEREREKLQQTLH